VNSKYLDHRILACLSHPILVIDRNYNIVDANDSSSTHFNLSIVRILGQLCYKVTHKSDTPCWELPDISCPVKTAFETQVRAQAIHKHFVKNELIVEEIVATPLDDDGNYVLEEFRDITELLGLIEGMLRICSSCRRVCNDKGDWHQVENYIRDHTGADFSHTLCPECLRKLYPKLQRS